LCVTLVTFKNYTEVLRQQNIKFWLKDLSKHSVLLAL